MKQSQQVLIQKMATLAPQRVAEVEDFVDFLRARDARDAAQFGELLANVIGERNPRRVDLFLQQLNRERQVSYGQNARLCLKPDLRTNRLFCPYGIGVFGWSC